MAVTEFNVCRRSVGNAAWRGLAGLLVVISLAACASGDGAPAAKVPITGSYVRLDTDEGLERLRRSTHKADFQALMTSFTTQERQTLCSVATGVSILNALDIDKPVDPAYAPHAYFTQRNYFSPAVEQIITREKTLKIGQTLEESALVMATHGAKTKHHHAAESSLDEFRDIAKANMARIGDFVAINYRRNFIGQPPGAHFSPLAAYDAETDSFLIMDVARYKFPPVWTSAENLFNAMNTLDSDSGKSRGFIVVEAGK